jgi:hypothetical protein
MFFLKSCGKVFGDCIYELQSWAQYVEKWVLFSFLKIDDYFNWVYMGTRYSRKSSGKCSLMNSRGLWDDLKKVFEND